MIKDPIEIYKLLPPTLIEVSKIFNSHNYEVFIVGGSIRDLILNKPVNDFDLATNATPEEVMRIFKRSIPTGIKHGTVTIIINNNSFEVTTYRTDGEYIDGRHPETVKFASSIKEDINRRDFTINSLAYNIFTKKIYDYYGGIEDLERGIIRTIGTPIERFREDGLRALRACRFACLLNFKIEKNTFSAIPLVLDSVKKVSAERIRDEIVKMLQSEKPSLGFELMRQSGLLNLILPELLDGLGITQNKFHKYDIYYHSIYTCDAVPKENLIVRLAALFHDIGKVLCKNEVGDKITFYNHEIVGANITKKIMKRLKFSNAEIDRVVKIIRLHMFHYTDSWSDAAVRRFMRKAENTDILLDLFILREADRIGSGFKRKDSRAIEKLKKRIDKIVEEQNAISLKDLKVNGYDIMKLKNIPPSPEVGRILKALLEIVIEDPKKNEKEILLKLAETL